MSDLPHRYRSDNRPLWIGALGQIREAAPCEVERVAATQTSFTIATSARLPDEVRRRFELTPTDTDR